MLRTSPPLIGALGVETRIRHVATKHWVISEYTPTALVLAPKALKDKADYLRRTDSLLELVADADSAVETYRHTLYESWVVFLWSYLEALTIEACDEIAINVTSKIQRADLKSKSALDSVTKYLSLVCMEEFPSPALAAKLGNYRKARNICAHNAGGRVERPAQGAFGDYTYISYGGGFQNLSIRNRKALESLPGIRVNDTTYSLSNEFCEELILFCIDYVIEFQEVSQRIGERVGRFSRNK